MFTCDKCQKNAPEATSPVRNVTQTRATAYHNHYTRVDDYGNKSTHEVDSVGHEVVQEERLCPECAKELGLIPALPLLARKGIYGFREQMADTFKVPVVYSAIENMLNRIEHRSKRAVRDVHNAAPQLDAWVRENKGFVF